MFAIIALEMDFHISIPHCSNEPYFGANTNFQYPKFFINTNHMGNSYLESVAGSAIQAIGTVELEDGLWMRVLPRGCWCPWVGRTYSRINPKPSWGCGLILCWVSLGSHFRLNSNSAEFCAWVVSNYSSYVMLG